jgi:hypothetical protein
MFVLGGLVYEYDTSERLETDYSVRRVTLKDLLNGGKKTYDLDAIAQSTSFTLNTYAFEDAAENDVEVEIEPDAEENDTEVFIGEGPAAYLLYDAGSIYLVTSDDPAALDGDTLGVTDDTFSNGGNLDKLETDDNSLYVKVVDESSDLNDDLNSDDDDRLIVLRNGELEYAVIDFYDRDFNESSDTYYSENVLVAGNDPASAALTDPGDGSPNAATDWAYKFQDEEDTVAITPEGGLVATIDYGSSREIEAVDICAPQDIVYETIFIGTAEQATTIDVTITKDDEGTEKTVGCCTYLVKEFGVSTTGGSAETVVVNAIVGNLVVPEIAADTTKNLIVVGGPAVNGLCGLTRDEIQAASGQYVVKKDGTKVYVAGWTAADTVDAGNALIAWLQDNVH